MTFPKSFHEAYHFKTGLENSALYFFIFLISSVKFCVNVLGFFPQSQSALNPLPGSLPFKLILNARKYDFKGISPPWIFTI